jgi:hypothetical protein
MSRRFRAVRSAETGVRRAASLMDPSIFRTGFLEIDYLKIRKFQMKQAPWR